MAHTLSFRRPATGGPRTVGGCHALVYAMAEEAQARAAIAETAGDVLEYRRLLAMRNALSECARRIKHGDPSPDWWKP